MYATLKSGAKALFIAFALLSLPLAGAHATETILRSFSQSYTNGANPVGKLAVSGSTLYGVSQYGVNGNGDIFKMTTAGAVTVLHEFNNNNGDGYYPNAGLVQVGSYFYGATLYGGSGSGGVLFRIGASGAGFTVVHKFTGYNSSKPTASDGAYVYAGLLLASDGNLYGTTYQGGASNQGAVFVYKPSTGTYSVIHSFNSSTDTANYPQTALAEGSDGFLYGTTYSASGYNGGLYKLKKDGTGYAFVHGFSSSDPAGYNPQSDLITASDGNLYGVCQNGGAHGLGTVFKLVTSTGTVSVLWAFDGYTGAFPGWYNGSNSQVRLTQGSDSNLYGVTAYGGINGYGTAFKLTLAGVCAVVAYFNYADTNGAANPLAQDGTSFYGTSYDGGIFANPSSFNGYGAAISISSTGVLKVIQTFYQRDSWYPYAGLVQDGNLYYGECANGGEFGNGYLYSVDAAGHFNVIHQMNNTNFFWEGNLPAGGLLLDSNDHNLYGMTQSGGRYGYGTIFKVTTTGVLTVIYDFLTNSRDGSNPYSALAQGAGLDKNLYGALSSGGGPGVSGTVFSTNTAGASFAILHYFTGPDGANPQCTPVPDGSGNLYGACYQGGAHGYGTIWKLSTDGATFTKVYDFDNTHGANPGYAGHLYLINGILYGTAQAGGANSDGVIWAYNTSTSAFSLLHTFNNNNGDGYYPVGLYYDAAGGNFYGCCIYGGASGDGTVWKINIASGTFTKLHAFTGYNSSTPTASDGAYPYYAPILGTDGMLYGATIYGGVSNNGMVFKQTTTP